MTLVVAMTPNETIRRGLYYFPSLYKSRADVLHHLFLVIGNGYEWVDGELVLAYKDPRDTQEPTEHVEEEFQRRMAWRTEMGLNSSMREIWEKHRDEDLEEIAQCHARIEDAMQDITFSHPGHEYPVSKKYSKVLNYPENITPEWEAARQQAATIFQDAIAKAT